MSRSSLAAFLLCAAALASAVSGALLPSVAQAAAGDGLLFSGWGSCQTRDGQKGMCDFDPPSAYGQGVASDFSAGQFDRLEKTFGGWCAGTNRLPDGSWRLWIFQAVLYSRFIQEDGALDSRETLARWRQQYPESLAQGVAEAAYWRARAASGLGQLQSDVSAMAEEVVAKRLARARERLDQVPKGGRSCAAWYEARILVGADAGESPEALMATYREGVGRFPEYEHIDLAMARVISHQAGENVAALERFAASAAARERKTQGEALYARIIAADPSLYTGRLGAGAYPHWEHLRQGFQDWIKAYPKSTETKNKFAALACLMSDPAAYWSVRRDIGPFIDPRAWVASPPDVCDRMAHDYVDEMIRGARHFLGGFV